MVGHWPRQFLSPGQNNLRVVVLELPALTEALIAAGKKKRQLCLVFLSDSDSLTMTEGRDLGCHSFSPQGYVVLLYMNKLLVFFR